jgi:hypothetical protein
MREMREEDIEQEFLEKQQRIAFFEHYGRLPSRKELEAQQFIIAPIGVTL